MPRLQAGFAEDFRAAFGREGVLDLHEFRLAPKGSGHLRPDFCRDLGAASDLGLCCIAGVLLSLTTLVVEREREIGILRSQGASCAQVQGLIFWEAAMIGLLAACVGLLGRCDGHGPTWVINKAFFGSEPSNSATRWSGSFDASVDHPPPCSPPGFLRGGRRLFRLRGASRSELGRAFIWPFCAGRRSSGRCKA
jgi:hypothetical protein